MSVGTDWLGPVDYLVVELPDGDGARAGFAAVAALVDAGQVQILDLEILQIEKDGVSVVPITDAENSFLGAFEGAYSGLLDDEDRALCTVDARVGTRVAVIVYEVLIVNPVVDAFASGGAVVLSSGPIPSDDLENALDVLDKE